MAIPDMLVYSIKIQWVLVWFPIARGAQIDRPFFNVGTFAYRSSDPTFEVTGPQFLLTEPDAERLEGVQATMDVDVDDDALFSIRLTACIGLAKERTTIKAKPDSRIPFMLNVKAQDGERYQGTAVTVHGTITTGRRQVDHVDVFATTGRRQVDRVEVFKRWEP